FGSVILPGGQEAGQVSHFLQPVAVPFGKLPRSAKLAGVLIGYEPLECADGDWLVDRSSAAGSLARSTADPSTDRGQWIRPPRDEVCALVVTGSDGADIAAGVGMHRAGELALDLTAPILLARHGSRKPGLRRCDHLIL